MFGSIRQRLGDVLNIAPTALAIVRSSDGNENVDDDRQLKPGDNVEFVKQSGSKG